jgi:hypothetical protein
MKVVWRGTIDEALETTWGGRTWEANVPQDVLSPEESLKKRKDGWDIEETHPETAPNGTRILVSEKRWISMVEAAKGHGCFDVEGEEPKVMKKRPKPDKYPNAAMEDGENIWIGDKG